MSGDAEIATVYAVFADAAEAERMGRAAVESGHAACVNILGACTSIYRWEGVVETASEVPALFKVAADRAAALVDFIAERHSYDVPAIIVWPVSHTTAAYANWVTGDMK